MPTPATAAPVDDLHPADELYFVRQQIRLLRAREAELAAHLIAAADRHGTDWRAVVTARRDRRIDVSRLPLSVRADPRYFADCERASVELAPTAVEPEIEPPILPDDPASPLRPRDR